MTLDDNKLTVDAERSSKKVDTIIHQTEDLSLTKASPSGNHRGRAVALGQGLD